MSEVSGDQEYDRSGQGRLAGQTHSAAQDILDGVKERVTAAGAAAQRRGSTVGRQMREAAEGLFDEQMERLAAAAQSLAEALRRSAADFEREHRGVEARYASASAAEIDRLCSILREREVSEMLARAADFARARPALFLAGAVAAGFAVARIATLPAPTRRDATSDADGAARAGKEPEFAPMSGG